MMPENDRRTYLARAIDVPRHASGLNGLRLPKEMTASYRPVTLLAISSVEIAFRSGLLRMHSINIPLSCRLPAIAGRRPGGFGYLRRFPSPAGRQSAGARR